MKTPTPAMLRPSARQAAAPTGAIPSAPLRRQVGHGRASRNRGRAATADPARRMQTQIFQQRHFLPEQTTQDGSELQGQRSLSGTIQTVICYKEDSGWAAVMVKTPEGVRKATGIMHGVRAGMEAEFTGSWTSGRYGPSFKADTFIERRPSDAKGIEKYLASGLIKFIGPKLAADIVAAFGEETLDVLDNEPERLREVHGIGTKRVTSIIESVKEQKAIRTIMIWLKRYDIPNALSAKIYKAFGEGAVAALEENPYVLADEIRGVGFKKADDVARRLNITSESPLRVRSGMRACLEDASEDGHTCMEAEEFVRTASEDRYLMLDPSFVRHALKNPAKAGVVLAGGRVFLPRNYNAEETIARRLHDIATARDPAARMPDIGEIERRTGLTYSERQREAIATALLSKVTVITGGPGTGKTATTNAVISETEARGGRVLLAAPTGRAAKRMSEMTGRPASTIHRLLLGGPLPLEGDTLIVDEASMIDTPLMRSLLESVPDAMRLILVGDTDQLPSVGPGSVLRDIIASGRFSTVRLDTIFRQAGGSDIVTCAHEINAGRMPRIDNHPGTDLWMFRSSGPERVAELVADIVRNRIPDKFGIPPSAVQVLTPMKREGDPIGAYELNLLLQRTLNPDGEPVASKKGCRLLTGDRIMQVRNNYEKELFNGDIGTVTAKVPPGAEDGAVMEADFDGRTVRLTGADIADIELSYACTVHKSQGSEYPAVVVPVCMQHFVMLKRNLLYTAVTRAKAQCILVGEPQAVACAVHQEDTSRRCTALQLRIDETFKK